ncbi:MAG: lipoate--protein ligase family protein [Euryarchaeota archaeon]|nr:lipoate--protein ligase family protein [Euryarchaeota archaeon]
MELRVIYDDKHRAYWNMGLDESLLVHLHDIGPTLRVYGWKPPAVSIGYFQSMDEEVNISAARKHGVDLVRRITGGGAVYHKYEITYSITLPENMGPIMQSYHVIDSGIIKALEKLGLEAKHHGINDVVVHGKKISGNAQTRKYGGLLQHGTLLMDVNVDEMFEILRVPEEKMRDKTIKNVKERVTSLHEEGVDVEFEELQKILVEGFKEAMNAKIYEDLLPKQVLEYAKKLEVGKYATDEWNFRR